MGQLGMLADTTAFHLLYQYQPSWRSSIVLTVAAVCLGALGIMTKTTKQRIQVLLFCFIVGSMAMNTIERSFTDFRLFSRLRSNELPRVEGFVARFVPEPTDRHADERFEIGGIRFAYRQAIDEGGYHQSLPYGGIVHPNQYLRVAYWPSTGGSNVILQIEIDSSRSGVAISP